jgi:hypothetical protein
MMSLKRRRSTWQRLVMTTAAVEQIMKGLIPSFEQASGHKVTMTVLGTGPAVERIKSGTFADLILLGPPALNELAQAGKVDAGTIAPALRSRIGLAVKAGAPKPDIRTPDALKAALLAAKSIGYSIGPSGEHFSKVVVVKLGIADQLRPKMANVRGMPVGMGAATGSCRRCRPCRSSCARPGSIALRRSGSARSMPRTGGCRRRSAVGSPRSRSRGTFPGPARARPSGI